MLWTKGIDILLALMHNARITGGDKRERASEPEVTSGTTVVADAPAEAAKPEEVASASPPPPPPPPSAETETGKSGEAEGNADGAASVDAKPFPIVLYGNGSDLDEVSRLRVI